MNQQRLVLVVDDDPDVVDAVTRKLEASGFRTRTAYDGLEAWEQVRAERPDLIVLDVMMPRKDGYRFCDELKKSEEFRDVVVILLTGVAEQVTESRFTHMDGKNTLADDYVPKPVDLDRLIQVVEENLTARA